MDGEIVIVQKNGGVGGRCDAHMLLLLLLLEWLLLPSIALLHLVLLPRVRLP